MVISQAMNSKKIVVVSHISSSRIISEMKIIISSTCVLKNIYSVIAYADKGQVIKIVKPLSITKKEKN